MRPFWSDILPSRCHVCGRPLDFRDLPGLRFPLLCWNCGRKLTPWPGDEVLEEGLVLLSAYRAGPVLLRLVKAWKYGGDDAAVPLLARKMARRLARAALPEPLVLVPVPLSLPRRLQRGFNQSMILAAQVANIMDLPKPAKLLSRRWASGRQAGRDRRERLERARREFRGRGPVPGEGSLVLVDDLCTTGATLRACRAVLDPDGQRRVHAIVAGRVPEWGSPSFP